MDQHAMDSITMLTWVIGLGGTLFAVLMGVMWSYILRGQTGLYAHVNIIQKDLREEIGMISQQAREQARDYDDKYARKDEVTEVKSTVNTMRGEMSAGFSSMNTHMGGLTTQMASIVSLLAKDRLRP